MAWGYTLSSPTERYHSAYLAVAESVSKLVATGFSAKNAYLTFQEYFERLGADPTRWGRPMASLLGALDAQVELGVAAIGGKDSMSGSFENIDVPPTLVSFAVAAGNTDNVVSPEFKLPGSKLVLLSPGHARRPAAQCREPEAAVGAGGDAHQREKGAFCIHAVHGRSGRGTVQNGPGQPPGRAFRPGL
jgi:phosphoribosylformylglycinamidine (FGAM) synthase-like enzyme